MDGRPGGQGSSAVPPPQRPGAVRPSVRRRLRPKGSGRRALGLARRIFFACRCRARGGGRAGGNAKPLHGDRPPRCPLSSARRMIGGMTETKREWGCGTCGLKLRNPKIGFLPLPATWDHDDEGKPRCAACRREASGAVGASAGTKARKLEVAKQMDEARAALLDHPDPGSNAALEEIADLVGCSVQKVRVARTQLSAKGEVAAQGEAGPRKKSDGEFARRAEEALRRDHRRGNAEIAREVGASEQIVSHVRSALGLRWDPHEAEREVTLSALVRLGESTAQAVGADLGIRTDRARARLDRLARSGRVVKRTDPARRARNGKLVPHYSAAA
jgi:hypothetical protein